jgi:hypothetical protein
MGLLGKGERARASGKTPIGPMYDTAGVATAGSRDPVRDDPILGNAIARMNRVKAALTETGLRFVDIRTAFAVGVGVGFADIGYTIVSVMGGGNEGVLNLTSGVLKRVSGNRMRILETCNDLTRDNASYPTFLHEAEVGADVLVQQRFLADMLLADASVFRSLVEAIPAAASSAREKFLEAGLGGQAHEWNDKDVQELLIRSVM